MKFTRIHWLYNFLFWEFSAFVFLSHRYATSVIDQSEVNWPAYFVSMQAVHLSWVMMTPPLLRLIDKNSPKSVSGWIGFSIVVAIINGLITTIIYALVLVLFYHNLGLTSEEIGMRIERMTVSSPIIGWVVTIVVLAASEGWKYLKRYEEQQLKSAQLREQLAHSQLQMLRMQINPHFLFNAFNTISMLIRTGQSSAANNMLAKVANFFRSSMLKDKGQMIALKDEISFCREYLEIEQVRFSDRLQVAIDIDSNTEEIKVPSILLQPLLENAFKHGLQENINQAFEVSINSKRSDTHLFIEVCNSGILNEHLSPGIGTKNIKNRLLLLYGDEAKFSLQQKDKWVVAQIILPLPTAA